MAVGAVLPGAAVPFADRRVFSTHGVVFTVADVARHGRVGGRDASAAGASADEVAARWRRARGLLTADALEEWLRLWAITPDEFVSWTQDVAEGTSLAPTWCALVCSGGFDAAVSATAAAAAAAAELGSAPTSAASFDPAGWAGRLSAAVASGPAIRDAVRRHRRGWTRIRGLHAVTARREVAAELRQWVLSDGVELATAAAQAGCPVAVIDTILDAVVPTDLQAYLAGTRPADIMGPVQASNGWNLVLVEDRTEPDHRDPDVRARAAAVLGAEALTRAVARHIEA